MSKSASKSHASTKEDLTPKSSSCFHWSCPCKQEISAIRLFGTLGVITSESVLGHVHPWIQTRQVSTSVPILTSNIPPVPKEFRYSMDFFVSNEPESLLPTHTVHFSVPVSSGSAITRFSLRPSTFLTFPPSTENTYHLCGRGLWFGLIAFCSRVLFIQRYITLLRTQREGRIGDLHLRTAEMTNGSISSYALWFFSVVSLRSMGPIPPTIFKGPESLS